MAIQHTQLTVLGTDNLGTNPTALDASVTQSSQAVALTNIRDLSLQLVFPTATTLAGTLAFQFTNYPYASAVPVYGWSSSSLYPTQTFTSFSAAASYLYPVNPAHFSFMKLVWTPSAGTGSILILMTGTSLN